jgi:hypothetical protein
MQNGRITGARWFLWNKDVGLEVVDLLFFYNFVDGRRRVLVQDNTGKSSVRCATVICALLRAAGLFIDSQSLVAYGAFLDLAMVRWRLGFSSIVRLGGVRVGRRPMALVVVGNPRDRFVFLNLL